MKLLKLLHVVSLCSFVLLIGLCFLIENSSDLQIKDYKCKQITFDLNSIYFHDIHYANMIIKQISWHLWENKVIIDMDGDICVDYIMFKTDHLLFQNRICIFLYNILCLIRLLLDFMYATNLEKLDYIKYLPYNLSCIFPKHLSSVLNGHLEWVLKDDRSFFKEFRFIAINDYASCRLIFNSFWMLDCILYSYKLRIFLKEVGTFFGTGNIYLDNYIFPLQWNLRNKFFVKLIESDNMPKYQHDGLEFNINKFNTFDFTIKDDLTMLFNHSQIKVFGNLPSMTLNYEFFTVVLKCKGTISYKDTMMYIKSDIDYIDIKLFDYILNYESSSTMPTKYDIYCKYIKYHNTLLHDIYVACTYRNATYTKFMMRGSLNTIQFTIEKQYDKYIINNIDIYTLCKWFGFALPPIECTVNGSIEVHDSLSMINLVGHNCNIRYDENYGWLFDMLKLSQTKIALEKLTYFPTVTFSAKYLPSAQILIIQNLLSRNDYIYIDNNGQINFNAFECNIDGYIQKNRNEIDNVLLENKIYYSFTGPLSNPSLSSNLTPGAFIHAVFDLLDN